VLEVLLEVAQQLTAPSTAVQPPFQPCIRSGRQEFQWKGVGKEVVQAALADLVQAARRQPHAPLWQPGMEDWALGRELLDKAWEVEAWHQAYKVEACQA